MKTSVKKKNFYKVKDLSNSQFELGYIYDNKFKNYNKSFYYYRKAAINGHDEAQCFVGHMYHKGHGVKRNKKKALKWYTKSALQNNALAQFNISEIYLKDKLLKNEDKTIYWLKKSAENGNAEAECNLGKMYEFGNSNIGKDINKALNLYEKSAKKGCRPAQYNLGMIYFEGLIVNKNILISLYWLKKAAHQGDASSKEYIDNIELNYNSYYDKKAEEIAKVYIHNTDINIMNII